MENTILGEIRKRLSKLHKNCPKSLAAGTLNGPGKVFLLQAKKIC